MSDFSEGEDDVFIRYEEDKNTSNNSDEEEIDVAAGQRWDPLGEEKEKDESVADQTQYHDRWVIIAVNCDWFFLIGRMVWIFQCGWKSYTN